jgi:NAD(P)-dependent dehydrogenase (short-subunit alcohol dehydrogenase family)
MANNTIIKNITYAPNWTALTSPPVDFLLKKYQIPIEQWNSLLWSTYYVGMEMPGRQALFSLFEMFFKNESPTNLLFTVENISIKLVPRFNKILINATTKSNNEIRLETFHRPKSVDCSIEQVRSVINLNKNLVGETVLITGGSRGFGAVLAKAFALSGAHVLLNYQHSQIEAENTAKEIQSLGLLCTPLKADASSPEAWGEIKKQFIRDNIQISILINNASPIIPHQRFNEQNSKDFLAYIHSSLAMLIEPCLQIIPILKAGGQVIQISSIFTIQPTQGFSHYIAAKAAGEGTIKSLATEYPQKKFIIARPPRMLTDQTNTILKSSDIISPIDIAKKLLDYVQATHNDTNFLETNLL